MKDLVEHIRTVHFTVFVVAFILAIALRGRTKPQLDRAAADAEAILLLQQKWPKVREAFSNAANTSNSLIGLMEPKGGHILESEPGRYAVRGYTVYSQRPVTFDVPGRWIYVDGTEPDENIGWGASEELFEKLPTSWKTLKEFLQFWDDHRDGARAFLPFKLATGDGAKHCKGIEQVTAARSTFPTAFLIPHATFKEGWQLWASLEAMDRDPNKHKQACDFLKMTVPSIRIDLGNVFAGIVSQANKWGTGSSSDEFKDLISEAKYLEDSPLGQLAGALRERANTDTERVELFQAKLPFEAIATYGAVVLIICQLYLLAHLLELRRLAQNVARIDWPTGYIGLYENGLIFLFTFVSMAVWPPLPLFLATRGAEVDSLSRYFAWTALVISIATAIASAITLVLIRKTNIPRTPEEKPKAAAV